MQQAIVNYIRRFVELNDDELQMLMAAFKTRQVAARDKLIRIGEVECCIYFVVSGIIKKYFFKGREEVVTQLACEGNIVASSVSFLTHKPSEYVVQALEDCQLLYLHFDDLEELYKKDVRFEKLGRLVTLEWLLQKEIFETDRLRLSPKERFIKFAKENVELMKRVPQKVLASYLNMQPETFSRYKHLLNEKVPT